MNQSFTDIFYNGSDFESDPYTGFKETKSIVNMIILGIFGGNVEQSEPSSRNKGEILNSWWGNRYGLKENSNTERLLRNITMSSATPALVKRSVENDLKFLTEFLNVNCEVTIPAVNRLRIDINLTEKITGRDSKFSYIWDTLTDELTDGGGGAVTMSGFDYSLDLTLS